MNRYVVAITGASGMIYARELLAYFADRPDLELHAVISRAGEQVLTLELGLPPRDLIPGATWHRVDDFTSPLASGSFRARAMVVIPCSMGTLGAIAQGVGRNLIHRAGEVFLKERRPLILVVRETPLSLIHLRNLSGRTRLLPSTPGPDGSGPPVCRAHPGPPGAGAPVDPALGRGLIPGCVSKTYSW
jgi:4-hydroxy-3-polyprenylbenzoate decarboxylase